MGRKWSLIMIFIFHFIDLVNYFKRLDFYEVRFIQAGFPMANIFTLIVPIIALISLIALWFEKNVIFWSSMLAGVNGVRLAIVPLPHYAHYHNEWISQSVRLFSSLSFVSAYDIKKNDNKIYNGSPSYACYLIVKIIPMLMISVLTFKFARINQIDFNPETIILGTIMINWIMSFIRHNYESPIILSILSGVLSSITTDIEFSLKSDFIQDMLFQIIPAVIYMHAAALGTFPFVQHAKSE